MEHPNEHQHSSKDISFHLATSDKELTEKVSSIMKRTGRMSFRDSMGQEHFVVDGRSGFQYLCRNIGYASRDLSEKNQELYGRMEEFNYLAVDKVLERYSIPGHLKGYRYLKYILIRLMENDTLLSPISKTLYADISKIYQCNVLQIDRDIRYAIQKSPNIKNDISPKALICMMLDDAQLQSRLFMSSARSDASKAGEDRPL